MYAYLDMKCNRHFFLSFQAIFSSFTPLLTPKIKFGKNVKNTWRYYPFPHVHHKSSSYDVWFLKYKVQRTKLSVILDHFLSFDPPNNPKNFRTFECYFERHIFHLIVNSGKLVQKLSSEQSFLKTLKQKVTLQILEVLYQSLPMVIKMKILYFCFNFWKKS